MNICLGSKNPVKLEALKTIFNEFLADKNISYSSCKADSLVPDQPIGLEETLTGAVNRAKNAFISGNFDLGAGIESGIIKDPTDDVYFNTTICALFDGKKIYKGLGPGFMLPREISKLLADKKMELDDAVRQTGYTDNKRIGYGRGLIGILSKGKIDRMRYTKPSVSMAVTAYLNNL